MHMKVINSSVLESLELENKRLISGIVNELNRDVSKDDEDNPASENLHKFASALKVDSKYISSNPGKTRVDGKEFFRQVRTRLSHQQFAAFLGNVKKLNSHRQTKEETLRKADEIFGSDNKDLYANFEGLITSSGH